MFIEFNENEKYATKSTKENGPIDGSDNSGYAVSDSLEGFRDAGYVLEKSDLVVDIDCLDEGQIKALIQTFDIKTETVWTDRGVHFYFKKPTGFRRARSVTPLGIEVEYKHSANTKAITVKKNGVERKVDNRGVRDELPQIFMYGRYENMLGLEEHDSRNNKLYDHKRKIASIPGYKLILTYINNHIFAVPLDSKEFESVTRDEVMVGSKDQEMMVADTIMREHKVVKYMGSLYFYENGAYTNNPDRLNRLVYSFCPGMKTTYVKEVIAQIDFRCQLEPPGKTYEVKFNNGILYDGKFIECNFTGFTPYSIEIDYDPNAHPVEVVDRYLDQLTDGDPLYRDRVLETMAHCLVTDIEFNRLLAKFHIFVGDGGNGKGTLLQVIKKIIGSENCSSLSIQNMEDERYFCNLQGKLVNLGDDIQDEPINNRQMKCLKNLSTSDTVEVRKLYENSFSAEICPTLIFTSNHVLKSFEKGESYQRRVAWLPMYCKPEKKEPDFISQLTTEEALRYWIRLIIEAYFRLYKNREFTECEKVRLYNEMYHEENNNTILFVNDLKPELIVGKRTPEIYTLYEAWCEDNGDQPLSSRQLKATILKVFQLEVKAVWKDGKTQKLYMPQEEINGRKLLP